MQFWPTLLSLTAKIKNYSVFPLQNWTHDSKNTHVRHGPYSFFPNCPQNLIPSFFILCLSIWNWLDVYIFHNGRKVGGSMQLEAVFVPFYSPPRKLQVYFLKTTHYNKWLYNTFFSVQNKIVLINALPYDPRNLTPNGHTWLTVAVKADIVDKNNYIMVDGRIIA